MDDSVGWATISEIARRLGRPDSTVRNWRRVYGALIPSRNSARGAVVYPLATFERIRAMADERLTPREIKASLGSGPAAEPSEPPVTAAEVYETLTAIRADVQRIHDLLAELVDLVKRR